MPMKTLIIHKNKQNTIEIYINNKLRFPTNMNNGTHNTEIGRASCRERV